MSKRGGFPGMGGFGGMNINQLMKEAKKMQADMEKTQEELQAKEFESTAGGGAVSVKVSGSKQILELKLIQQYSHHKYNHQSFNKFIVINAKKTYIMLKGNTLSHCWWLYFLKLTE